MRLPGNIFFKVRLVVAVFVLMWALVTASSCTKQLQNSLTTSTTHQVHDSTSTTVTARIDTVIIPADTVTMWMPLMVDCPEGPTGVTVKPVFKPIRLSATGKRSDVTISIDSAGNLKADAHCKKLEEQVLLLDKEIQKQTHTIDSLTSHQVTVQQVRFIPKAYKWAMWFSCSFLIALLLFIAYKIFKLTPYGKLIPF